MRFLLDTNIVSEVMSRTPHPGVFAQAKRHTGECAMSATTWHELRYGISRLPTGRRKLFLTHQLQEIADTLPVLPYDEAAAAWHAEQRVSLAERRMTAPFVDSQIAAVAAVRRLVLVTRNTKDFRWYSDELVIENWFTDPPRSS